MEKNGKRRLGIHGEKIARRHLKKLGYRIVATQYRTRWGEIDIVARKSKTLSFIEVKTRTQRQFGTALMAIDSLKWVKFQKASMLFLQKYGRRFSDFQLEFIGIGIQIDGENKAPKINWVNLFPN